MRKNMEHFKKQILEKSGICQKIPNFYIDDGLRDLSPLRQRPGLPDRELENKLGLSWNERIFCTVSGFAVIAKRKRETAKDVLRSSVVERFLNWVAFHTGSICAEVNLEVLWEAELIAVARFGIEECRNSALPSGLVHMEWVNLKSSWRMIRLTVLRRHVIKLQSRIGESWSNWEKGNCGEWRVGNSDVLCVWRVYWAIPKVKYRV